MRFSQRLGYSSVRDTVQHESMNDTLCNGLWSVLYKSYFPKRSGKAIKSYTKLYERLWMDFFKHPVDTLPDRQSQRLAKIRDWFFKATWYEAYDFVEIVPKLFEKNLVNRMFRERCNAILKREMAGYRFVGPGHS